MVFVKISVWEQKDLDVYSSICTSFSDQMLFLGKRGDVWGTSNPNVRGMGLLIEEVFVESHANHISWRCYKLQILIHRINFLFCIWKLHESQLIFELKFDILL